MQLFIDPFYSASIRTKKNEISETILCNLAASILLHIDNTVNASSITPHGKFCHIIDGVNKLSVRRTRKHSLLRFWLKISLTVYSKPTLLAYLFSKHIYLEKRNRRRLLNALIGNTR